MLVFGFLLFPSLIQARPFVTTWNITEENENVTFSIYSQSSVTINWGDSNSDNASADTFVDFNHTYVLPGLYNVSIEGQFFHVRTDDSLVDIVSWGDGLLVNGTYRIPSNSNLRVSAPPNTQPMFLPGTTLSGLFASTSFNSSLDWDLTNVTNIGGMFSQTPLNQPITFRNTRGVTRISGLFYEAAYFNQPFHFDASGVVNGVNLFYKAVAFNQVVNLTNSSQLTSTSSMFQGASSFNQPLTLNTDSVTAMNAMFLDATSFASTVNFTSTAKVTTMGSMFSRTKWFTQDLSSWDTRNVTICGWFCPWCGLPSFSSCNPCFMDGPIFTDDRNLSVCSNGTRSPSTSAPSRAPSTAAPSAAPSTSAPSTAAPSNPSLAPSTAPSASLVSAATKTGLEFVAVAAMVVMVVVQL